jgi:hypothetical protein
MSPVSFTVPNMSAADYRVYVVDDLSQYPVNVGFTVTP